MSKILATLCYVRKNEKTLMLHRIKKKNDIHKGKYNGLGGKFVEGESPQECVVREVYEESGLKIKKPLLKGVLTFPLFDGKNDWVVFVFTADRFSGEIIKSKEGNLVWVKNSELLKLNLWEGDRFFMRYLNRNTFFSGKFVYKNGRLISHRISTWPR